MKINASIMNSVYTNLRSSINTSNGGLEKSTDNPLVKRLSDLQEGFSRLNSMPKQSAKQASMNKVGWLKQRLDALKQLLLRASPEQAKALARELKSIARELASAAKDLGASSSGQVATAGAEAPSAATNGQEQAANVATNEQEQAASVATNEQAEATVTTADTTVSGVGNGSDAVSANQDGQPSVGTVTATGEFSQRNSVKSTGENSSSSNVDDAALRSLLHDAKKRLKEVVDMLKPKLAAAGKEAADDMRAAEKSMSALDSALQQEATSDFYDVQGSLELSASSLSVSGVNINLTA